MVDWDSRQDVGPRCLSPLKITSPRHRQTDLVIQLRKCALPTGSWNPQAVQPATLRLTPSTPPFSSSSLHSRLGHSPAVPPLAYPSAVKGIGIEQSLPAACLGIM